MTVSAISPATLAQLHGSGKKIDLIDVRTPVKFQKVRVEFARNVPLDQLEPAQIVRARNGSANGHALGPNALESAQFQIGHFRMSLIRGNSGDLFHARIPALTPKPAFIYISLTRSRLFC